MFGCFFVKLHGKHWNAFVRDWVTLPKFKNLFIKGKAKKHIFGLKDLPFSVMALRQTFEQPRRQLYGSFSTTEGGSCSQFNNCYVIVIGTHSD